MKKIAKRLPLGLRIAKLAMEKASPDLEFRVGACLIYKNHIFASWNRNRTAPQASRWFKYYQDGQYHAEYGLFSNVLLEQCPIRGTVYTYRLLKDGSTGLARPCKSCLTMLKTLGIKKIVFSDYGNIYREEKI